MNLEFNSGYFYDAYNFLLTYPNYLYVNNTVSNASFLFPIEYFVLYTKNKFKLNLINLIRINKFKLKKIKIDLELYTFGPFVENKYSQINLKKAFFSKFDVKVNKFLTKFNRSNLNNLKLLKFKEKYLLKKLKKNNLNVLDLILTNLKLAKIKSAIKKYNLTLELYNNFNTDPLKFININNKYNNLINKLNNFLKLKSLNLTNDKIIINNLKFSNRYNPFLITNFNKIYFKTFKFIKHKKKNYLKRLSLFKVLLFKQKNFQLKLKTLNAKNLTKNILLKYRLNLKKLRQEQKFKKKYFSIFLKLSLLNQIPKYNSYKWFILIKNLKKFRKNLINQNFKLYKNYTAYKRRKKLLNKKLNAKFILNKFITYIFDYNFKYTDPDCFAYYYDDDNINKYINKIIKFKLNNFFSNFKRFKNLFLNYKSKKLFVFRKQFKNLNQKDFLKTLERKNIKKYNYVRIKKKKKIFYLN